MVSPTVTNLNAYVHGEVSSLFSSLTSETVWFMPFICPKHRSISSYAQLCSKGVKFHYKSPGSFGAELGCDNLSAERLPQMLQ